MASRRSLSRVALALSVSALAAAAVAPSANAAFATPSCGGTTIGGLGASFQVNAQSAWATLFNGGAGCSGSVAITAYPGGGSSGAGLSLMGARLTPNLNGVRGAGSATSRFGGTDDPPTPAQRTEIEAGPTVNADGTGGDLNNSDDGPVHVVPVAVGAVAVIANVPSTCVVSAARKADAATSDLRMWLTSTELEKIFAGDATLDHWNEIPGVSVCTQPIKRAVRGGVSGTTFGFKYWLDDIDPANSPDWSSSANLDWPNVVSEDTTGPACEADTPAAGSNLCRLGTSGGNLSDGVANSGSEGTIGYVDLATARSKGFTVSSLTDKTVWLPIANDPAATLASQAKEPQKDATGYQSASALRGAACDTASFSGTPGSTFGDWSTAHSNGTASAVNTKYGGCTLTYDLAFDDNVCKFPGSTYAAEDAKARTLKDYLTMIVTSPGQGALAAADYAPLPSGLQTISIAGVTSIDYDKDSTGGACTNIVDPGPGPGPGPGVTTPPVITNVFTIPGATAKKGKNTIALTLQLPGAGKVAITGKSGKTTVGKLSATNSAAGATKLNFKLSSAGKKLLKKKKKLKVALAITFTPNGGTAKTVNKTVTVKK